jgi:hypothetical protein
MLWAWRTIKKQQVNPGIYLYAVGIVFIDGTVLTKSGKTIVVK